MELETAPYCEQAKSWPATGRVILAQFNEDTIVVYQAYRPSIGQFAAENGYFGSSDFSFSRMTWIKPNFLWMMYRSGWGTKDGQEVTLAIRVRRSVFNSLLGSAVHSAFEPSIYRSREQWAEAVAKSDVRIQWDPDHDPMGRNLPRRAVQLGLRGDSIRRFSREWIVGITDISGFVSQQRQFATAERLGELQTPVENVYSISDRSVATRLGLDQSIP